MHFKNHLIAVAGVGLITHGVASAAHIDFFSESDDDSTLILTSGETSETDTFVDPEGDTVLGQTRRTTIEFAPGGNNGFIVEMVVDTADGILAFSNSANTRGTLTLDYGITSDLDLVNNPDGPDYQGLRVDVVGLVGSFDATVTATDTGNDSDSVDFDIDSTGNYTIDYDAFSDSVDFDSIDLLSFMFVSQTNGAAIDLNQIIRVVPEPLSAGAAGLLALVGLRRRR